MAHYTCFRATTKLLGPHTYLRSSTARAPTWRADFVQITLIAMLHRCGICRPALLSCRVSSSGRVEEHPVSHQHHLPPKSNLGRSDRYLTPMLAADTRVSLPSTRRTTLTQPARCFGAHRAIANIANNCRRLHTLAIHSDVHIICESDFVAWHVVRYQRRRFGSRLRHRSRSGRAELISGSDSRPAAVRPRVGRKPNIRPFAWQPSQLWKPGWPLS